MSISARAVAFVERVATPDRVRGYALLMGAVFVAFGVLNYAAGEGHLDAAGNVVGADFLAFYTGARLQAEGRLTEAYRPDPDFTFPVQLALQRQIVAPQVPPGIHPFVNPPHAALLYRPFAAGDYLHGALLWWAAGGVALWLAVRRLRGELAGLRRWSTARLYGACFLFVPTMSWVGYGQVTALTLWIYVETFVSLRRGRDAWAGAVLGCLAYKPQLAVAPALALLCAGRWRAILAGAISAALWGAIGVAIDGEAAHAWLELAPRLTEMIRLPGYPTYGVHNLLAFFALLLDPTSPSLAGGLALATSLGAFAWLALHWLRAQWAPGEAAWDLRWAATFALGLVASPHLFVYDLMLLLLPFALLVEHRGADPHGAGLPLGGGPLLTWTVAVWALCSLGTQLSMVQELGLEWLGLSGRALQLSVIAVVGWAAALMAAAGHAEGQQRG